MEIKKGIYKHYKGNIYRVIGVAKHSETLDRLVVYRDVGDETKLWARPAEMWNDEVEADGKTLRRFELIAPEEQFCREAAAERTVKTSKKRTASVILAVRF